MSPRVTVIVMTRYPCEGRNKTRLIPALGSQGATVFHERLARHTIGRASSWCVGRPHSRLVVWLGGARAFEGRRWLGDVDCRVQKSGDLGERMQEAVEDAFAAGSRKVIVIGTDCPRLDEATLSAAGQALDDYDVVFGPAHDGGYFLVGFSRRRPEIFQGIDWGSSTVLSASLERAHAIGASVALLDPKADVDHPEDLADAELALREGGSISVIIPVLNESENIGGLIHRLNANRPHEILVADGGSSDGTPELATAAGARVIATPRGRASQMNHAAALASGEFLLFLHADTRPPENYSAIVTRVLQAPATSAGAFRFGLDDAISTAALIEAMVHLRCRFFRTPFGDQGLFLRRTLFHQLGGFPQWPVMEDVHLVRKLNQLAPVRIADEAAMTSSRCWRNAGFFNTFIRYRLMLMAYHLRVPPRHIARLRP